MAGGTNAKIEKSWSAVLVAARTHHNALVDEKIVDEEQLRLTVAARPQAVAKLSEQGLSQRQIANELVFRLIHLHPALTMARAFWARRWEASWMLA
jgi:hypothetical protein